jgi:hypothetical protein
VPRPATTNRIAGTASVGSHYGIDGCRPKWQDLAKRPPGRQLLAGWQAVPMLQRFVLLLGTRRMLARYAATEDLPDVAEIMVRDKAQALTELLLDRRDALLATALDDVLVQYADEPVDIAVVVYGAGHMPALTRYLVAKHGFRPREVEGLTVFDF